MLLPIGIDGDARPRHRRLFHSRTRNRCAASRYRARLAARPVQCPLLRRRQSESDDRRGDAGGRARAGDPARLRYPGHAASAGHIPRRFGRRRQRRLRRRAAERLDADRYSARVQDGHRSQHWRPDRALRLPRPRVRSRAARGLHQHDRGEGLSARGASLPPCSTTPWPTPARSPRSSPGMPIRRCSMRSRGSTRRAACS